MALPSNPKISDQANQLRDALKQWAQDNGGVADVASNYRDMWDKASRSSQKPTVLICWMGDNSRGEFSVMDALHRVDRQWTIAVVRGRGLSQQRGDSLTETVGNAEPFYDINEEVRDIIRSLLGISQEPVTYKGCRPMQLGNVVVDGYLHDFSTANDLPQLESTPDQPALPQ